MNWIDWLDWLDWTDWIDWIDLIYLIDWIEWIHWIYWIHWMDWMEWIDWVDFLLRLRPPPLGFPGFSRVVPGFARGLHQQADTTYYSKITVTFKQLMSP